MPVTHISIRGIVTIADGWLVAEEALRAGRNVRPSVAYSAAKGCSANAASNPVVNAVNELTGEEKKAENIGDNQAKLRHFDEILNELSRKKRNMKEK